MKQKRTKRYEYVYGEKEVCMERQLRLPVGIDSFEKLRNGTYYYVDKTELIEQVLEEGSEVTLFTRPRRFGKSLNMSMLKSFFEVGTNLSLFEGLYISQNTELCKKYMGRYPVIAISLKGVDAASYEDAYNLLIRIVNEEAERFQFLLDSEKLTRIDKMRFEELLDRRMEKDTLAVSLRKMTALLEKHYDSQVVVLIDEYDVPLAKAHENGYYDEMVLLFRNMFGNVLKTNDSLAFAVLTGCLRIAKESIFTGLNNFKVYSITDDEFDETFGFTSNEVQEMLQYYGLNSHFDKVREWYDGYRFGSADVYCPWDVVNYCSDHRRNPDADPKNYWMNTSGNDVINHFIDSVNDPGMLTKGELELLVNGETIIQKVDEMVTYKDLYSSIDNLWSTLFMTGYLTQRGQVGNGYYRLAVPNCEIRTIMIERVLALFRREVTQNGELLRSFCHALIAANAPAVERLLTEYMGKTISVRENFAKTLHENFYHGLLIGILGYRRDWEILSNRESGDGFSDILIETKKRDNGAGIVIELKYSDDEKKLDTNSREALQQIEDKNYVQELRNRGYQTILKYGIAFCHKKCRVLVTCE